MQCRCYECVEPYFSTPCVLSCRGKEQLYLDPSIFFFSTYSDWCVDTFWCCNCECWLRKERGSKNILINWTGNICVIQPDTQCFMTEFIHNIWWLDMFRISVVHLQERLQAVCCGFGMWYCTQNTTYQIRNIQLLNAPEDGLLRSETCRVTKCYE